MMKRILSIVLCLCMLVGIAASLTSCGDSSTTDASSNNLPMTINLVGITGESTTPEAIAEVEKAFNKLTKSRYNTQVLLTLKTADEYIAEVERRVQETLSDETDLAAKVQYNNYAIKQANKAAKLASTKQSSWSKWTSQVATVVANTLSTGVAYTAEETTVFEDGRIEIKYPDADSQIDILMISDKAMYDYLDEKGYLLSIASKLTNEGGYSKFYQYIYPTFFSELKAITGDIKAIPNNNLLGEYTYLVVDKALADKYDLDVDDIDTYDELSGFLAQVKANESVVPMATEPEALGIYKFFEEDIAVGTYFDPIYGYNEEEGTDFFIQNLFDIPQYRSHLALMNDYRAKGYFTSSASTDAFAVTVIKGDASVSAEYGNDYYVKVLQNPFVEENAIFNGMLAVASCTSNVNRALNIIEMIDTDPDAKNILQYGIEYTGKNENVANYRVISEKDEKGSYVYSIERLNQNYMMDNALTGNVYMGYPEEGQNVNAWTYYKQTNLDSALSPFLSFYLSEKDFDSMLDSIIRRAAMTEILSKSGIDYDDYEASAGTPAGTSYRRTFKNDNLPYFMGFLAEEKANNKINVDKLNMLYKPSASNAVRDDYLAFMSSRQGLEIFRAAGFFADVENAPEYQKKGDLSGTVTMGAYINATTNNIFKNVMAALAAAYTEMYPNVTINVPQMQEVNNVSSYRDESSSVISGKLDVIFVSREIQSHETSAGLAMVVGVTEAMTIFSNDIHATYSSEWYEKKYIAEYQAEHFANLVTPTQLDVMVFAKMAELAGTSEKNLNSAITNAQKYSSYIDYLRTMTGILLFDHDPDNSEDWKEWRTYAASFTDVEFENYIFNYVKENYEKEHNLSDDDYAELVRSLMTSVLYFYDSNNQKTEEPISWAEFQQTKADAQEYIQAAEMIKSAYNEKLLAKYPQSYLNLLTLPDLMTEVYNIMYEDYLKEHDITKKAFENSVKDQYLTAVGTTAEEFATYGKNSDEYKAYVEKLRNKFKKILVAEFSSTKYKQGEMGISNEQVLSTLFAYHLENTLNLHEKMSEIGGMSYDEFLVAQSKYTSYRSYLMSIRDSFLYTLRTRYTDSQINNWSFEEIEVNVYNTLYDVGFYSNEMAKYIGLELRDLMLAKSNATSYYNYISKIVNALAPELKAAGYDPEKLKNEKYEVVKEICSQIIEEKYFSDKIDIKTVMESVSGEYVRGIQNATDSAAYAEAASKALHEDDLFMAVVNELQAAKISKK